MDPAIGRFTTMDRYCEKYYNLSPYQFAANNPINNLEINGDSVWFSVNRDSHNKITEITMNVTGKVLNDSNNNINMKGAINTISGAIRGAFKGKVDGAKFSTNINLEKAANMNEVKDGDHLFVLTDKISQLKGDAEIYGAANMDGGKVAFIDADYFVGPYDELIGSMGEGGRTAAHEFGHLLGLKHTNNIFNLMRSNGAFRNISGNQLNQIYNMRTNQLNRGSNYELNLRGQKRPNRGNRDASIYIRP